ncbi:aladin [Hordeum vulgare subsp. vulgare]|uniref:Aladin seven-bladed propeller domain-containing protein n=1 Tax=Hordeum vulgare subsp. vulgare TaxID=112509 RepID=A0A287R0J1_HORVV|nr:aladin [Hordeum vulgare subsp. vulgare]
MPSFPPPGGVTVCEINRDLVVADSLSEERAKEAYGDVLGMVFSPIPFQPDDLLAKHEAPAPDEAEPTECIPRTSLVSTIAESFKQMLFPSCNPKLLEEFDTKKVSWNPHKHCLAFVSGKDQVTVHDFEDSDGKESCSLTSEHQKEVKAIEWRPNSGKMIAVGCKGGICLWSASYPGNVASVKSGVTSSSFGAFPRGSTGQWILVDVLRGSSTELVSALCWKPDGRYLASASCNGQSFTIWDVSEGLGTPIRRGLSSISLVRWSPSGDYFLTAKFDGTFHLWETNTWTSEPWSSSNGYVTGANWDPEGRVALLSFSNSTTLGSVHFSSKPPSLDAHLLPVELPEISSLIVSRGIEKLAWDASGERLALSFKDGNETYQGLVAVYDVRRSPLVSVSLVGFIRGPGEGVKALAFAFHNKFKQGPLLSVCWSSGWCCTYPLILRSH